MFLIGGDFNFPDIDWNWKDLSIKGSQYTPQTNQTFLDIIADNSFEQIVDFPTRNDTILDLILMSHPSYRERCKPLPSLRNSDHDIVLLDTTLEPYRPKPERRKIYLWRKADIDGIRRDLSQFRSAFCSTTPRNVHTMWNDIKSTVHKVIDERVPTKLNRLNTSTHG